MEFLWPGQSPIQSNDKARLRTYEESRDFESASKLLEPKVGPLFYRVRKQDLELEDQVFYPPITVKMNENERLVYDAIVNKIKHYSREDYLRNIDLVARLRRGRMIRVRQCLSYTKLLTSALEGYTEDLLIGESEIKSILLDYDQIERPAKLDALVSRVKELRGNDKKVLIWSNFLGTIDLILKALLDEEMHAKKITGAVPIERENIKDEETREQIRDDFVDPNSGLDILVANPAACAESISLHKTCHHAIYYDLSYNLAQYLQSLDRIHRVGGSENQSAYYDFLSYEKTIDSDILASLEAKAERMYRLIDKDYSIYSLDMSTTNEEEEAYERHFR